MEKMQRENFQSISPVNNKSFSSSIVFAINICVESIENLLKVTGRLLRISEIMFKLRRFFVDSTRILVRELLIIGISIYPTQNISCRLVGNPVPWEILRILLGQS